MTSGRNPRAVHIYLSSERRPSEPPPRRVRYELHLSDWLADSFRFHDFDRRIEALIDDSRMQANPSGLHAPAWEIEICLRGKGSALPHAARQIATRCQRLTDRRNDASEGDDFDRVLAALRRLHGVAPPTPRTAPTAPSVQGAGSALASDSADKGYGANAAAYAKALDSWQWVLRLAADAALAPQLAALCRSVEPCAAAGVEAHRGSPGQPPAGAQEPASVARARRRAWKADELLAEAGIDLATRIRVHQLLIADAAPGTGAASESSADPLSQERALVAEATALSFLSLDSAAHLDIPRSAGGAGSDRDAGGDRGAGSDRSDATTDRVAAAVARLRPTGLAQLANLRLHADVARSVRQARPREVAATLATPAPASASSAASAAAPSIPSIPSIASIASTPSIPLGAPDAPAASTRPSQVAVAARSGDFGVAGSDVIRRKSPSIAAGDEPAVEVAHLAAEAPNRSPTAMIGSWGLTPLSARPASPATVAADPGRSFPTRAASMARSRLAVGIAGAAGLSRSRVVALLARAAAIGTLAAPLDRPPVLTPATANLVSGGVVATAAATAAPSMPLASATALRSDRGPASTS